MDAHSLASCAHDDSVAMIVAIDGRAAKILSAKEGQSRMATCSDLTTVIRIRSGQNKHQLVVVATR